MEACTSLPDAAKLGASTHGVGVAAGGGRRRENPMLGRLTENLEFQGRALKLLAEEGALPVAKVREAIERYGIAADKPNPITV